MFKLLVAITLLIVSSASFAEKSLMNQLQSKPVCESPSGFTLDTAGGVWMPQDYSHLQLEQPSSTIEYPDMTINTVTFGYDNRLYVNGNLVDTFTCVLYFNVSIIDSQELGVEIYMYGHTFFVRLDI